MDEIPDDLLVNQSRKGDPRALALLYRRHAPALLGYLQRLTGERAEAEDLLQETYLRVFQGRGRYDGRGRFRAWLFTIATRLVLDRGRRLRRQAELAPVVREATSPPPPEDPGRAVDEQDLLRRIESALADLPPAYAQAFFLRVREDCSYREMASICNEPEGTLRSRVHHALKRIRNVLNGPALAPPGRAATRRENHECPPS